MTPTPSESVPAVLRHQPDSARPGCFQIVDAKGVVYAEGIPTEAAARLFATSPQLLLGYDVLLDEAHRRFHDCWDVGPGGPDFDDFVHDDGELEALYPGAPEYAAWLRELSDPLDAFTIRYGEDEQVELSSKAK